MTIPATVMVLTRNAADTLPAALESVSDFADVVVCDGRSTDNTVAIAERFGARVIEQDEAFLDESGQLHDYAGVRFQVVAAASQPWIFHLDADEIATPDLVDRIREIADGDAGTDAAAGYECSARHVVGGTVVRSAANYPMRFLRIFRTDAIVSYAGPINEGPVFAAGARVDQLSEHFLIPMPPLRRVVRKWMRYQRIIARDAGRLDLATWWRGPRRDQWRVTKWLAWRTWKSRRVDPSPHMPLRYDVARVVFHFAGAVSSGVGAVFVRSPRSQRA